MIMTNQQRSNKMTTKPQTISERIANLNRSLDKLAAAYLEQKDYAVKFELELEFLRKEAKRIYKQIKMERT